MFLLQNTQLWVFPHSSVGKDSACNAGDLGSIPGLGRSPGEGKGYMGHKELDMTECLSLFLLNWSPWLQCCAPTACSQQSSQSESFQILNLIISFLAPNAPLSSHLTQKKFLSSYKFLRELAACYLTCCINCYFQLSPSEMRKLRGASWGGMTRSSCLDVLRQRCCVEVGSVSLEF